MLVDRLSLKIAKQELKDAMKLVLEEGSMGDIMSCLHIVLSFLRGSTLVANSDERRTIMNNSFPK